MGHIRNTYGFYNLKVKKLLNYIVILYIYVNLIQVVCIYYSMSHLANTFARRVSNVEINKRDTKK